MRQTWRWFGPDDPVSLKMVSEAGAVGIVTALHQHNRGEVWPPEEVEKRRAAIEAAGLTWDVVESIGVGEAIKTRSGDWRAKIDSYKQSLRYAARAGVKVFCYNFMAITDWTRTDLMWPLPRGGYALRFDAIDFAAYDLFVLEREGAEKDYPPARIAEARARLDSMSAEKRAEVERTLIDWLPARDFTYERASFREALARYREIGAEDLRARLFAFVREITEVAEEEGVKLAIHPDDPSFPIFGLPRVMSNADDVRKLFAAVPSPACGLTFCAGSFGANGANDLPAMLKEFGERVHFAHLRSVQREPDGSFHEAEHLEGDSGLIALVAGLLSLEAKRGVEIPMRPDHGHLIGGDDPRLSNPGYSYTGRLKGLAELRGAMRTVEAFRSGRLQID